VFYHCQRIDRMTIPSSVTFIGQGAFEGWTTFQRIFILGHANSTSADRAWARNWRDSCSAIIEYLGQ